MRRHRPHLLLAAVLGTAVAALPACGTASTATATASAIGTSASAPTAGSPSTSPAGPSTSPAGPSTSPAAGGYIEHATYAADPARYAGGRVVLFFHAPWCSDCRRTDRNLLADPTAVPAGLTVVKVDFDSSTDLRRKYGVTHQHTFVSVAADGSKQRIWTGTDTAAGIAAKA